MAKKKAAGGTPATEALTAAGVPFTLHEYAHDPGTRHFGDETIAALGLDPQRVFKTLLVDVNPGGRASLAVGVVPVAGQLDLKAIAAVLGAKKAEMAEPKAAERSSGYVVGGISPLGQKRALPTFVDESAQLFDVVYVSGGRRGFDIGLSPTDLLAMTGGEYAPIARERG